MDNNLKEKWAVVDYNDNTELRNSNAVATIMCGDVVVADVFDREAAEHIINCVNGCKDIPEQAVKDGVISSLIDIFSAVEGMRDEETDNEYRMDAMSDLDVAVQEAQECWGSPQGDDDKGGD